MSTVFYPEFNEGPPDEYYAEEWERRCKEMDEKAEQELFDLFKTADVLGADYGKARPEVGAIIRTLFDTLDPSNPTEASLMHLLEKADRICRVSSKAMERMVAIEADRHRYSGGYGGGASREDNI